MQMLNGFMKDSTVLGYWGAMQAPGQPTFNDPAGHIATDDFCPIVELAKVVRIV